MWKHTLRGGNELLMAESKGLVIPGKGEDFWKRLECPLLRRKFEDGDNSRRIWISPRLTYKVGKAHLGTEKISVNNTVLVFVAVFLPSCDPLGVNSMHHSSISSLCYPLQKRIEGYQTSIHIDEKQRRELEQEEEQEIRMTTAALRYGGKSHNPDSGLSLVASWRAAMW